MPERSEHVLGLRRYGESSGRVRYLQAACGRDAWPLTGTMVPVRIDGGHARARDALCHAGSVSEWVLFLGAGASVSAPTRLPAFPSLARGVLAGVGWRYAGGSWRQKGFPTFVDPGRVVSPEVLFGTLQAFEVNFAPKIAGVLDVDRPNAAHRVAAAVIESGGMVWTTNVDRAVEAACRQRGLGVPPRFGRQTFRHQERRTRRSAAFEKLPMLPPLGPLIEAGPGGLVKFHGTAEDPTTLAFTDRELMTPLPDVEVAHLARQAKDRTLVLYGYAGADADLADLLDLAIDKADDVLWFEPSLETRDAIGLFFPTVGEGLVPPLAAELDTDDLSQTVPPTARAFLERAALDGYAVDDDDNPPFAATQESPPDPELDIGSTPGIMSARLVERFGPSSEELHALLAAFRRDVSGRRWSLFPAYARWTFSRSFYNHGIAAQIVEFSSRIRSVLVLPGIRRLGDPIILRKFALLLTAGDWEEIGKLAEWSLRDRRRRDGTTFPSDYYYRAYARRYALRPGDAAVDAEIAVRELADALDPERLAGALLESGAAAIYQGRFDAALRRAFELQYRRGRYAIRRWQSWGGWLEAMTHCHLRDSQKAETALSRAFDRFDEEEYEGALADLETVALLAERVRRAAEDAHIEDVPQVSNRIRTPRQQDDLDLVLGDLELASAKPAGVPRARQHYQAVADKPSCPVAAAWARLGLAEVACREGRKRDASDEFEALVAHAKERSATWLETQAVLGLHLTAPERAVAAWLDLRPRLPNAPDDIDALSFGDPRVLWTITV
jgi:hypothetical protein